MASSRLIRAQGLAMWAHGGQEYRPGVTYYNGHLVQVAIMVREQGGDEDAQIVALLHDSIEDTAVNWGVIQKEFGRDVANDVFNLTRLGLSYEDYLKRIKNYGSSRAKLVKLCDLKFNLAMLDHPDCPPEKLSLREKYTNALAFLEGA